MRQRRSTKACAASRHDAAIENHGPMSMRPTNVLRAASAARNTGPAFAHCADVT
jgi:hypothetical protein